MGMVRPAVAGIVILAALVVAVGSDDGVPPFGAQGWSRAQVAAAVREHYRDDPGIAYTYPQDDDPDDWTVDCRSGLPAADGATLVCIISIRGNDIRAKLAVEDDGAEARVVWSNAGIMQ
jgi:hypothetical protein